MLIADITTTEVSPAPPENKDFVDELFSSQASITSLNEENFVKLAGLIGDINTDRLLSSRSVDFEHPNPNQEGSSSFWRLTIVEKNKQPLLITTDITDLVNLATTDKLTGVFNRRQFDKTIDDIEKKISDQEKHQRNEAPINTGVLFCDANQLKKINDSFGHSAGDAYLEAITILITSSLRAGDLVFRTGGDEFVALLPDLPQETNATKELITSRINGNKPTVKDLLIKKYNGEENIPPSYLQLDNQVLDTAPSIALGFSVLNKTTIDTAIKTAEDLMFQDKKIKRTNP